MDREKINKRLGSYINKYKDKSIPKRKVMAYMLKEHNIMATGIADVMSLKKPVDDLDDMTAACLLLAFIENAGEKVDAKNYLSDEELNECRGWKVSLKEKINFPLEFRAVKVAGDQWIGSTTLKELMKIKSLITYDTEAQRPMTRQVIHGEEKYEITLNASAVEKIRESMENETYIPNAITLNIPIDSPTGAFSYDNEECVLSFTKSFTKFNILDGYHRYVAMELIHATNPDFDMPMEIRFTNFELAREQQFIYQEDQKTKMKKLNSNSFNQESVGTKITSMIASGGGHELSGVIKRNNGIIDFRIFANGINGIFVKSQSISNATIINLTSEIKEKTKTIVLQDPTILDKKWSWKFTYALLVCVYKNDTDLSHIRRLSNEYEKSWKDKIGGNEDANKRRLTKAIEIYDEIF